MSAVEVAHRWDGPEGAPVVVLSNSLGTTTELWDRQVGPLAERFRVLRYDHRGHGGSPVPGGPYSIDDVGGDLLALLDRLGLERVSVCGVSLGGMTAMWLAGRAPERIDRIVLCCTSAHLPPRSNWTERAATVRAEGTGAIVDAALDRWFSPAFRAASPDVVAQIASTLGATPPEGYAGCCEAIGDLDLRAEIPAIRAPTLVIAGGDDPATPPGHARVIRDAIPDSRALVIPHARHLANIERADLVTPAILDHLEGLGARLRGLRNRREVLGDEHVDRALDRTTPLTADFQDVITRYAWGEIWDRPGLDRRTRSAITLTALTALGRLDELKLHVAAARRNGLTDDEIAEVLLQCAIYCGVPAANAAFAAAREVLDD
jgi:3-oxoadipate enol-lactonase/4-carboxymuconolactone decarboxylase